jgi:outer membrane protein OmpA-like peptidoglycan-associated protein
MIRKSALCTSLLGSMFACTAALAQDATAPQSNAASSATQPSASGDDVIHLHMPVHHHARRASRETDTAAPAENTTVDAIGADTTAPTLNSRVSETPAAPAPQVVPSQREKASQKGRQAPATTIPFSFGDDSEPAAPAPASIPQQKPAPQNSTPHETKTASLPPKPMTLKPPPLVAARSTAPHRTRDGEHAGLTKRGAVLFAKGMSNPSPAQLQGVKLLATTVSTALESGASRVQLEAYGGTSGDKSWDARRLSLKRALAVRQLLIDDGVPSSHIVVRAMGGADDNGPDDRVDVFVSS